jgi:hypothetical protein
MNTYPSIGQLASGLTPATQFHGYSANAATPAANSLSALGPAQGELSVDDDDSDDDRPLTQPKISPSERAARQDHYASQMKYIVKALKDFTVEYNERRFMALPSSPLLLCRRSWCSGLRILTYGT